MKRELKGESNSMASDGGSSTQPYLHSSFRLSTPLPPNKTFKLSNRCIKRQEKQISTLAESPSCKEARCHHSFCHPQQCPLYATTALVRTGIHAGSGQRRGRSNQSEEEGTPLFSRLSHSTAGGRGTLIHLKKKYVPSVFIPSTFQ